MEGNLPCPISLDERAARLIDFMAEDGIVGAYNGSNAREVLYTPDQWATARGVGAE